MLDAKQAETYIKERVEDYFLVYGTQENLTSTEPYQLFLEMYRHIEPILKARKEARGKNFSVFRAADDELWQRGHAVMALGVATKLGWVDADLMLVPRA